MSAATSVRAGAPGAGDDGQFRQIIADRYKRQAAMRSTIKATAVAQLIYILARTAWKAVPSIAEGSEFYMTDQLIGLGGAALFLAYHFAFGFGLQRNERQWAIQVYSVGSMLLLAEVVLTFWAYHVLHGATSSHPELVAAYPVVTKAAAAALRRAAGLSAAAAATAEAALGVFEKALDVVGFVIVGYGVHVTKEYVMLHREQKREAAGKAQAGPKAE